MDQSQFKPGFDVSQGLPGHPPAYHGGAAGAPAPPPPISTALPTAGIILRAVAVVLTFISAVVMGAARQTTTFVGDGLVTSIVTKSTYSAAYVYFVVANVLVFFYSIVSLALSVVNKAGMSSMLFPFSIADLLMVVLLFSGNGAAAAISIVAEHGQANLARWGEICSVFDGFCARVNAAIVLSMMASAAYVLLVVLGIAGLRRS